MSRVVVYTATTGVTIKSVQRYHEHDPLNNMKKLAIELNGYPGQFTFRYARTYRCTWGTIDNRVVVTFTSRRRVDNWNIYTFLWHAPGESSTADHAAMFTRS